MFAIHGEILQPRICAVGHQQARFSAAQIHRDAVRTIELAGVFTFPAKSANELALAVVLVDVARASSFALLAGKVKTPANSIVRTASRWICAAENRACWWPTAQMRGCNISPWMANMRGSWAA